MINFIINEITMKHNDVTTILATSFFGTGFFEGIDLYSTMKMAMAVTTFSIWLYDRKRRIKKDEDNNKLSEQ